MVSVITDIKDWAAWLGEDWSLLPYAIKIQSRQLPASWEAMWHEASPYSFVLESGKDGTYTIAGLSPVQVLRGTVEGAKLFDASGTPVDTFTGKPLAVLEQWMKPFRVPSLAGLSGFSGGFVGYFSYDVARSLEKLPRMADNDLGLDDYVWMRMEEVWIYDHTSSDLYCVVHLPAEAIRSKYVEDDLLDSAAAERTLREHYEESAERAERMLQDWRRWEEHAAWSATTAERRSILASAPAPDLSMAMEEEGWTTPFKQEPFQKAVGRIQEYIAAGDVFQVNLSLRHERKMPVSAEELYEWFRLVNPSPYMGLLRFPDFQLVSGSPELLVSLRGSDMGARPIAGTRRRGHTEQEDLAMAQELLSSEKERAEHIMLVDLERNDLGRVAAYGSVQVSELLKVEYYSHVMHLVSQVDGKLASGKSLYDLIGGVFPGGTITGAPKVRTMEIIEELEPVTRGPYTGSIGWIDYQGNMELNIVIRTLIVKDGQGYIQTGAGIVIDSDPYREYRECGNKAKAARAAVYYSERMAEGKADKGQPRHEQDRAGAEA